MDPDNSKAEVKAFAERWKLVNQFEIDELRRTPPEVKLRQFFTLLQWAKDFGWEVQLGEGVDEVRERWARLRRAHAERSIALPLDESRIILP